MNGTIEEGSDEFLTAGWRMEVGGHWKLIICFINFLMCAIFSWFSGNTLEFLSGPERSISRRILEKIKLELNRKHLKLEGKAELLTFVLAMLSSRH